MSIKISHWRCTFAYLPYFSTIIIAKAARSEKIKIEWKPLLAIYIVWNANGECEILPKKTDSIHSIGNPEIQNRIEAKNQFERIVTVTHGLIGLVIQHHHKVNMTEIFES